MQSTDVEEIKTALWEQAYHPYEGPMGSGTSDGGEKKPWALTGAASRAGTLVSCASRDH